MVWVYEPKKHKHCNLRTHETKTGKQFVMRRKKGGGTRRQYLH